MYAMSFWFEIKLEVSRNSVLYRLFLIFRFVEGKPLRYQNLLLECKIKNCKTKSRNIQIFIQKTITVTPFYGTTNSIVQAF